MTTYTTQQKPQATQSVIHWRQTRRAFLMAQSPRCHYCDVLLIRWTYDPLKRGIQPTTDYMRNEHGYLVGYATLDHKKPIVCGGHDSEENTVLACAHCNAAKGHMDYDDFVAIMWETR